MTLPEGIVSVHPVATATYTAMCWIGDAEDPALVWMAERYGWKIQGMTDSVRKGRCLKIIGKNRKTYLVSYGEYVIALGGNGSMAVVSSKEYRQKYREVSA